MAQHYRGLRIWHLDYKRIRFWWSYCTLLADVVMLVPSAGRWMMAKGWPFQCQKRNVLIDENFLACLTACDESSHPRYWIICQGPWARLPKLISGKINSEIHGMALRCLKRSLESTVCGLFMLLSSSEIGFRCFRASRTSTKARMCEFGEYPTPLGCTYGSSLTRRKCFGHFTVFLWSHSSITG
jgi:hypothetical protein